MSKSQPSPPPPPDPRLVANAQAGSNISTAVANSTLGNVNQVGPTGSTTYNQTGGYTDPNSGTFVPSYTQTRTLDPALQSVLTGTEGASNFLVNGGAPPPSGAVGNLAQLIASNSGTPLDFSGTNENTISAGPQVLDQRTADAIYGKQAGFLDPQWQQNQKDLEDQLSRQGIPIGSDAYNRAMTNFNNSRTQAYDAARSTATAQAVPAAAQNFNMALLGQQQNVAQQQLQRTLPISMLTGIYGSGIAA